MAGAPGRSLLTPRLQLMATEVARSWSNDEDMKDTHVPMTSCLGRESDSESGTNRTNLNPDLDRSSKMVLAILVTM